MILVVTRLKTSTFPAVEDWDSNGEQYVTRSKINNEAESFPAAHNSSCSNLKIYNVTSVPLLQIFLEFSGAKVKAALESEYREKSRSEK
ncbi:hypothetical protein RB195_014679 [Necator americanus]|uniref:Uncharacterized protein n=1 Tax=Necator americanus TaxID=51031 RepID=A0ABR1E143_NECAM